MAVFSVATGLRQANVKGLEWQYVDLGRRHAWIPGSKHKDGKPHPVPLNEMALSVLPKQIGKHPTRMFTFGGEPITQVNTKAWTAALKRAGIENFKWHDLRHTFATWHRQAGTPTHELQRLGVGKPGRWSNATHTLPQRPCRGQHAGSTRLVATLWLRHKNKGPSDLSPSPCFYWWALRDSNTRPTD